MQGCLLPLLSMICNPDSCDLAYLPRHWACAIDVVELVATLGGEDGGTVHTSTGGQPWSSGIRDLMSAFSDEVVPQALLQLNGDE